MYESNIIVIMKNGAKDGKNKHERRTLKQMRLNINCKHKYVYSKVNNKNRMHILLIKI